MAFMSIGRYVCLEKEGNFYIFRARERRMIGIPFTWTLSSTPHHSTA
jgi:hypothetical protein